MVSASQVLNYIFWKLLTVEFDWIAVEACILNGKINIIFHWTDEDKHERKEEQEREGPNWKAPSV